jgi:hypothetical protein
MKSTQEITADLAPQLAARNGAADQATDQNAPLGAKADLATAQFLWPSVTVPMSRSVTWTLTSELKIRASVSAGRVRRGLP